MAKRDYDIGKRIQRRNAQAEADRKAVSEAIDAAETRREEIYDRPNRRVMREYIGLMMCERCHTEQDDAPECRVCGQERF